MNIRIHKEGYALIAAFFIVTLVLSFFSNYLAIIGLIASVWCIFFFRDPNRVVPMLSGVVVSPADGVVQSIVEGDIPPFELGLDPDVRMTRISIFLDVFNVHVNRAPITGKVEKAHYRKGKFINASLDKASIDNERQSLLFGHADTGYKIPCVQIAGLIARRIVCDAYEGGEFQVGDRFGIIRFGSRVDVYLPQGIRPMVHVNQTMVGGETILANLLEEGKIIQFIEK
ncbi:phosphatidylserine decarboxylase [Candidatus Cyrtobacter comes]|nr:phosphatidylserine decarboxylase [Candidatus Cyrtobacter comes]